MEANLDIAPDENAIGVGRPALAPVRQARASVDILVVAYNSRPDLERCLPSIADAARTVGARVIVVDNASTDGTLEMIRGQGVEAIEMPENLGYAAAINAGAAFSQAEYLAIVNPDVKLYPEAVAQLVSHLEEHPHAGAVAPRLLNSDGSLQDSVRRVPTLGTLVARQTRLGETRWGRRSIARYLERPRLDRGYAQIEWALGAALVVRRTDFDRLGGWDDRYFLYFEDVDFCVRLREAGREVHELADVELVHEHRRASDRRHGSAINCPARRAHFASAVRFFMRHPHLLLRPFRLPEHRDGRVAVALRRTLDVVFAGTLLLTLLPLIAAITLAIRIDSKGPVLFRQRRFGRHAVPFTMFKFRTMRSGAEETPHREFVRAMIENQLDLKLDGEPQVFKLHPDPRVTRVGRVLRRWSLDELPQLWNVLRGDMTIVGFRPPIPYEVETYPAWYYRRFDAKPGLTGLWQTSGRNETSYDQMVRYDIEYHNRRTWRSDVHLMLKTLVVVLARRGAY